MAKRRKDGYYQLSFVFNGKRYVVYSKNRDELAEKKVNKIKELKEGKKSHDNPTLDKFYEEFTERRRGHVKESSIRHQKIQYETMRSVVVMSGKTLGEMRIKDITPSDIEAVQKALQARTNPKPLATQSINDYMNHLKHVFKTAIKMDIIEKNPCRTLYSLERTEKPARDTIHRALTHGELDAFLEGARERHSYYLPLFLFMLNTGVRIGEAGGITDDDIKQGRVHIVRTVSRDELGSYCFQKPKTAAGLREIPLNEEALQALALQRKYLSMLGLDQRPTKVVPPEADQASHPRKPPIFCSPEGQILREYTANREISRICKAKGIKKFTSHALRDTFATLYTEYYPTKWKTLQTILGHKDADTTLNIYIHAVDSDLEQTMKGFKIRA